MRAALLLASTLALPACSRDDRLPPEVDAFRRELADPARYPLREGTKVDEKRLQSAIEAFGREHRDRLDRHFRGTVAKLPPGEPPAGPAWTKFREADGDMLGGIAESRAFVWTLFPDAEMTFRTGLGMLLPQMLHQGGAEPAAIGGWIAFLNLAKPALSRKEHGDDRLDLIADYGGVDVLVLTMERVDGGWTPAALSWWRRAS